MSASEVGQKPSSAATLPGSAEKYIWRCHLCIDCGEEATEPAAARAFLKHYTKNHPDPIAAWNTAMKEGDAA